jgi:hypothetical protein
MILWKMLLLLVVGQLGFRRPFIWQELGFRLWFLLDLHRVGS